MMLRAFVFAAAVLAATSIASPANASADTTCYPEWKIRQTQMNGCSSTALLSPGNDTRVNLLMLLHDRHGSVGVSNVPNHDSWYDDKRRGEAQPFGFAYFAGKLGPGRNEQQESGDFPWGTRCMSSDGGASAFVAAVGSANGLSGEERAILAAARSAMRPQCSGSEAARAVAEMAIQNVKSRTGKAFAGYLIGAAAFYDGELAAAHAAFSGVGNVDNGWLSGATAYMLARTALNQATESAFGEYGDLKEGGGDKALLAAAEAGFRAYLKVYPNGGYAASARGLLRRAYWLGQDKQKLLNAYVAQFAEKVANRRHLSLVDLVQELDLKLFGGLNPDDTADPDLLAAIMLREMRYYEDDAPDSTLPSAISRASIEAKRGQFAGREELYNYLLAAHAFYVAKQPAEVLKLIPANMVGSGYFGYSCRLLRALALDATGDPGAKAALIAALNSGKLPFQRGVAELGLAMHLERNRELDLVFSAGSVIRDPEIRDVLLRYSAGPGILRRTASEETVPDAERSAALYILLYKQLLRGDYAGFVENSMLVPTTAKPIAQGDYDTPRYTEVAVFNWAGQRDFSCPAIRTTASTLAASPNNPHGLLCLGEFIRTNGMDPSYFGIPQLLDDLPENDELGGRPSLFPGTRFSRLNAYKAVIANPAAGAENRAYALHRAVRCYAPAGYNGCDTTEQPLARRKAWFQQLKREYPTSPWSTKLTVYW